MKQGLKQMKKPSVVQLTNDYINDENTRQRFEEEETRQKNRFMGWVLICVILLFILPIFNLVQNYSALQKKEAEITKLQTEFKQLKNESKVKQDFAKKLSDEDYVAKYARAKYYFSKTGETIYPEPDLLPK